MSEVLLTINDLHKSFSTPVLKGINLSFMRGEIHSIIGENGAGKSTLMNILTGQLYKWEGSIIFEEQNYSPTKPSDAQLFGISSAAQELSIIGTLSVAENILLRKLPNKLTFVSTSELEGKARYFLDLIGLEHIDASMLAEHLTLGESQLLELAKALAIKTFTECKLLILDEPTAALSGPQADKLHSIIKGLSDDGVTIIYISHRLEDVRQISDRISVMRDGAIVKSSSASNLSIDNMISMMSGKPFLGRSDRNDNQIYELDSILEINGITNKYFQHPISFKSRKGEIVGVAGLAGSGRTELLKALFGLSSINTGTISLITNDSSEVIKNSRQAVKLGIGYLSKDRKKTGILAGQSLAMNLTLPGLSLISSTAGIIDSKKELEVTQDFISKLAIKCTDNTQSIESLSGGNQQKVLLARWLHCDSKVLLLDEPTRGVDINAKHLIYNQLNNLRQQGKSIIIASSEIEELTNICDRIIVLSNFKLVKEFKKECWSKNEILTAAFQEFTTSKSVVNPQNISKNRESNHVSN